MILYHNADEGNWVLKFFKQNFPLNFLESIHSELPQQVCISPIPNGLMDITTSINLKT